MTRVKPDFATIEAHLGPMVRMPHWVICNTDKIPFTPGSGGKAKAKANDPTTWGSYEQAKADVEAGIGYGIGFQLKGSGIYGFDLDHVVDLDTGDILPTAKAMAERFSTYVERSLSGTGLHGYGFGDLQATGNKKSGYFGPGRDFEVYGTGRYLVVTGAMVEGFPKEIKGINGELDKIHLEVFGKHVVPTPSNATIRGVPDVVTDEMILQFAHKGFRKTRFAKLWLGNIVDYAGDASAADQALVNLLAYWCGPNEARIDRLFRQSGLFRDKWDTPHYSNGQTYGQGTIASAIRTLGNTHSWPVNPNVPPAPPGNLLDIHYLAAYAALGYRFRQNELDATYELNEKPITDGNLATIRVQLRNNGYVQVNCAYDVLLDEAQRNSYHPIEDYLEDCEWDGTDSIGKLASYFTCPDGLLEPLLRAWLVGAVAKVYKRTDTESIRTAVLVLVSRQQGIGKSQFCKWLCKDVPRYASERRLDPGSKDVQIALTNTWIWELSELGAVTNRAETSALKGFLSRLSVKERKAYDRVDTERPVLASFIGTANDEPTGLLTDPTGSLRFMTTRVEAIDWRGYTKEVDVKQVWAQARVLFESGEPWELSGELLAKSQEINTEFEMSDPLADHLETWFEFDPEKAGEKDPHWWVSSEDLIKYIHSGYRMIEIRPMEERALAMALARDLTKKRCQKSARTIDGKQRRGWYGIRLVENSPLGKPDTMFDGSKFGGGLG